MSVKSAQPQPSASSLKPSPVSLLKEDRPARVLLCDDEPTVRDSLRIIFEWTFRDYELAQCDTGYATLREVARQTPDLLITDCTHVGLRFPDTIPILFKMQVRFPILVASAALSPQMREHILSFPTFDMVLLDKPFTVIPRIGVPPQAPGPAQLTTAELLQRLRSIDWFQFEKLVAVVYRKLGYTVTRRGGANPDGGIDLVVEKDAQQAAVQCKQWKTWNVGVKAVREFLGALTHAGIPKGIFITLCGYTGEAKQLADNHAIEIVNETGLAHMLQSVGASSDPEVLALLRDTRKFCPKCESEMVLRTATKGLWAGKPFWGCSAFPRCRFTMPRD